jgi:hypothetical protein
VWAWTRDWAAAASRQGSAAAACPPGWAGACPRGTAAGHPEPRTGCCRDHVPADGRRPGRDDRRWGHPEHREHPERRDDPRPANRDGAEPRPGPADADAWRCRPEAVPPGARRRGYARPVRP